MITKQTKQIDLSVIPNGEVLLFDKPKGKSSFFVIGQVRKKIGIRKVGHAGTLDPMATGLLIVCVGKKTKEIYKYQDMTKVYTGTITIGAKTPSMDAETGFVEVKPYSHISINDIEKVRGKFLGNISQTPPMYSAIKHKGRSLYKYARKGIEVERKAREVEIYSFNIVDVMLPEIKFEIECSKGTYIRVLADDFGNELGCGAYLSELRRTKIGKFSVNNAVTLEEFKNIETI